MLRRRENSEPVRERASPTPLAARRTMLAFGARDTPMRPPPSAARAGVTGMCTMLAPRATVKSSFFSG